MTWRKYAMLLLAGAPAVALLLYFVGTGSTPDFREVRPPTPVSNEPIAEPEASEPTEEASPRASEVPDETVADADRAACLERYADNERPSRNQINEVLGNAARELRASGSQEHMLAAAKIEQGLNKIDAEGVLDELDAASPHDPLALWTRLTICESDASIDCDFEAIEANIRRNHSGNSAFWMAIAGHHISADQEAAALEAMRMAVGAPVYDSYFAEQFLNVDRALAATTNWSAAQRAFHTVEFVATSPPGYSKIMSKCKTLDVAWTALCDELAARLVDDADEIMARGFGTSLQVELHEARNGSEGIAKVREELRNEAFAFMQDEDKMAQSFNALLNDETLLRMFLENLESYGEIKAFERLIADVERLRNTDGYDQCNFVVNPYTF